MLERQQMHWKQSQNFFFFIFQMGKVQMDAAVMNGQDLNYGGVMCIGRLFNKKIYKISW